MDKEDTLKGRCHNCGRFLNLNDAYYAKVGGNHYVTEFCDSECHQAHLDTNQLEFE